MKVFAKKPDTCWYVMHIDNTLEALQRFVKGYIETVTLFENGVIICNEEGRIRNLPHNTNICGCDFVGNILFVGTDGEEFCDAPVSFQDFRKIIHSADNI